MQKFFLYFTVCLAQLSLGSIITQATVKDYVMGHKVERDFSFTVCNKIWLLSYETSRCLWRGEGETDRHACEYLHCARLKCPLC